MSHVRRSGGLPTPFWMKGLSLVQDPIAARRQWVFGWLSVIFGPCTVLIGCAVLTMAPVAGMVWLAVGLICCLGVPLCRRGLTFVVSWGFYLAILGGTLYTLVERPTDPASPAGLIVILVLVATTESTRVTLFMVGVCAGTAVLPLVGRSPDLPSLPVGANLASRVTYIVVVGAIAVVACRSSQRILDEARTRGRKNEDLTRNLQQNLETLEAQVAERTEALAERTNELERITAELDDSIVREMALATQMRALAETDDLTGLANRRGFMSILGNAMASGSGWLVLADLDHFKRVNDTFGHPTGDQVLHRCAQLMAASVPDNCSVARIGGEEFAIVLPDGRAPRTAADVDAVLGDVLRAVRESEWSSLGTPGVDLTVSVSLGAAGFVPGDSPAAQSDVLRRADAALYLAKSAGRGRGRISQDAPGSARNDAH